MKRPGGRMDRKKQNAALVAVQLLAAGVFAWCFVNIAFWMEDSFRLSEMSKSYEESELFFRQVDEILGHKIRGQENSALFEVDGAYSLEKEIDIQSYGGEGSGASNVKDMNTTYRLEDLVAFGENGGQQALREALQKAQEGNSRQAAGELLAGQSEALETVLPVTGIPLSECSRWYSDPADFVLNMYSRLDEAAEDIYGRYLEYTTEQDESWSDRAPGNLSYCIENSSTGELFTNTGAASYQAAAEQLRAGNASLLYEGERSFNIVVVNPEGVLNASAADWFMEERFVNTNEKVLLAVDLDYPVSDPLKSGAEFFARREGSVWGAAAGCAASGLALAVGFLLFLGRAGQRGGEAAPVMDRIDAVPTELAGCLGLITFLLTALAGQAVWSRGLTGVNRLRISLLAVFGWGLFLLLAVSLRRRLGAGTLWKNSILHLLVRTWKRVTSARAATGRTLFLYLGFFVLNFLFLLLDQVGVVLTLALDLAVLLYLLRDIAGKQSVFEGIHQISKGDLDYKIDLSVLAGESYEMGLAVNEMGDGLKEAVDAIVKNERLKAELITNVSHDIKTPLTSIVNYVDLLKRENLEGERVRQYLDVLDQKSQRLKQLTEDLVEASKISSGNIELNMARLELNSILDQAYGEFEERFCEKNLTPVLSLSSEGLRVLADGRQLWRVLENLFGNICKYALEGSRVYLSSFRDGDSAVLLLKNTSREALTVEADELTGRFVRGDQSRNTEGSGLGLSIAKSLAELMGGELAITVEGDLFQAALRFPLS